MRRQRRRTWHVQRTGVPTETGQQRWDRVYQLLLQWATTPPAPTKAPASPILPEVFHARSDLRARLDQPQVDHQTIEQQLERLTAHVRAHAAEDWALNLA